MRPKLPFIFVIAVLLLASCSATRPWRKHDAISYQELGLPAVTQTKSGKNGDPVNIGFIGRPEEIFIAFAAAGWQPADALTFKTARKVARSVVMKKPYPDAPVSTLCLFGRPEDLAFEKEVGNSPRQRHHVRLWKTDITAEDRPLWIGGATYDRGIYLRKFSHHIAPDVDAERAALLDEVTRSGNLDHILIVNGIGPTDHGRNGEGDPYFTDGMIHIGWLKPAP